MKISILLPDLSGGGVERIRIVLAHEFVNSGHEVEFVLMQAQGELLKEAHTSFSVVDLATPRARSLPFALVRYLRQHRPDALLAAMWPLTVIAPLAQRLSGHRCKVIVSEHNTLSVQFSDWGQLHRTAMRASMAMGYRLSNHRIGVSQGVIQDISTLSGLRPTAFNVIYNPVPPRADPLIKVLRDAEELWAGPQGGRIVTVGSMKAQKNHVLLMRAFAQLDRPDARLMFVGDGPRRNGLMALAQNLGIANQVIFAGFHLDPTPFYKTADLFVLSSDYEGFGNVIVEALACGTPVVSTDCPSGPAEILMNGKYGHLVPVREAEKLAKGIEETLQASHDTDALISRAAEFSPSIAAQSYLKFLFDDA
jgi:glycosyltransferase involved in cell wall biosynthesis